MQQYNWNQIVEALSAVVRLQTPPVGMKWIQTEAELAAIEKVRTHTKHLSPCMAVSHAAQLGWTSACRTENVHANYCRGINGMFQRDERWYSGEMFHNVWFSQPEDARAHNLALECVPPDYIAVVASPLVAGRIEPDVCVLHTTVSQAFLLLAGYQEHGYERLAFTFVGESTCSDSWVHTFCTGKPGLGLPCYADRKFAGVGEHELRLTFTPAGLLRALEGAQRLSRRGLRYPMASYSLTTDMLDGLPPHYLEF